MPPTYEPKKTLPLFVFQDLLRSPPPPLSSFFFGKEKEIHQDTKQTVLREQQEPKRARTLPTRASETPEKNKRQSERSDRGNPTKRKRRECKLGDDFLPRIPSCLLPSPSSRSSPSHEISILIPSSPAACPPIPQLWRLPHLSPPPSLHLPNPTPKRV